MDPNLNQLEQEILDTRVQEMKLSSDQMIQIQLKLKESRFNLTAVDITNIHNSATHLLLEIKDPQHRRSISNLIKVLDLLFTKCNLQQKIIDNSQTTKN